MVIPANSGTTLFVFSGVFLALPLVCGGNLKESISSPPSQASLFRESIGFFELFQDELDLLVHCFVG